MRIYLAGNYAVINVEGREKEIVERTGNVRRLLSFADFLMGCDIEQAIRLNQLLTGRMSE